MWHFNRQENGEGVWRQLDLRIKVASAIIFGILSLFGTLFGLSIKYETVENHKTDLQGHVALEDQKLKTAMAEMTIQILEKINELEDMHRKRR